MKNSKYNFLKKEEMEDFLKNKRIQTPDDLIQYYVTEGKDLPSHLKRVMTTVFIKSFGFSREDITKARLDNSILREINRRSVNERYHKKVEITKEFASNRWNDISEEEIELFKELILKRVKKIEIAKRLKRTYSTVEYLCRRQKEGKL